MKSKYKFKEATMRFKMWTMMVFIGVMTEMVQATNKAPVFIKNMNQFTIKENTPVGSVIYTLEGEDPEGSRVR